MIKSSILIFMGLLTGCAGVTPIEDLEAQALKSGDWSAVERRERLEARRNLHSYMRCPPGSSGYCESLFGSERCECVSNRVIRTMFSPD